MTGYRIAEDVADPFAIDPKKVASQRRKQDAAMHGILTLCTLGIWLPVLAIWWIRDVSREPPKEYALRLRGGVLQVGTPDASVSVPLDSISRVAVANGHLQLFVPGGTRGPQVVPVYGLVDPTAAAEVILEARLEHMRSLERPTVDEEVEIEAEASSAPRRRTA